jgi:hypothetical protein
MVKVHMLCMLHYGLLTHSNSVTRIVCRQHYANAPFIRTLPVFLSIIQTGAEVTWHSTSSDFCITLYKKEIILDMTYKYTYILSPVLRRKVAQAETCVIDIPQIASLNLGRNTDYPEGGLGWLSLGCAGYYIKLCHRRILPYLFNLVLTNDNFNSTPYILCNQQRR